MMTPEERTLVRQLIEKVNRLEKRLGLQETIEVSGGGSSYTDEQAQDAVGTILTDSTDIDFDYADATPLISALVKSNSITNVKAADMANATVKGRTTAGTGDPEDLTMAQLVALIEVQALYALLAGRSGGQTLNGGTGSGENLTLSSTAHATKGKIFFGAAATSAYDGVNNRLGIGGSDPVGEIESISVGTANAARGLTSSQHNSGVQAAIMNFRKSRGNRASQTTVANGDFVGDFVFQPYDGTNYLRTVQIAAKVNGTVATASVPTDIIFTAGDTDDASLTNVRMTIKSTGEVGIPVSSPAAQLDVLQATLGSAVQKLASTATNDDPIEIIYQNRVATTDATVTSLHVFTLAQNTTYTFDVWVTARRTAGTGVGLANDGAGVHMNGTYKGMTGTATIVGTLTVVSSNLNTSIAAVTMDVTGATVRVRVTGTASNSITFHMTARVNLVAS